jgi:hypothetical protein
MTCQGRRGHCLTLQQCQVKQCLLLLLRVGKPENQSAADRPDDQRTGLRIDAARCAVFPPYSFRSWAEWFPHCACRAVLSFPPLLNDGLRRFCSQLRASNEGLLRPRVARAKRANRFSPSPPIHDDESTTTHPRSAQRDSWLTPSPAAVRQIDGW